MGGWDLYDLYDLCDVKDIQGAGVGAALWGSQVLNELVDVVLGSVPGAHQPGAAARADIGIESPAAVVELRHGLFRDPGKDSVGLTGKEKIYSRDLREPL